jgi:hypothetical protein
MKSIAATPGKVLKYYHPDKADLSTMGQIMLAWQDSFR